MDYTGMYSNGKIKYKQTPFDGGGERLGGDKYPCYCYDKEGHQRICGHFRSNARCRRCCERRYGGGWTSTGGEGGFTLPIYTQR